MSAEPLIVVDGNDAPAVVRAGSPEDRGVVTLGTIVEVIDEAGRIAAEASDMSQDELARAVATLATEVRLLAGEVYQLSAGAMKRRISVVLGDD